MLHKGGRASFLVSLVVEKRENQEFTKKIGASG
jgi:hypothetical protein